MFPNPGPLQKAMGKSDTLPGFLFSNPVVAGFFAIIMLPVFGAVAPILFSQLGTGGGGVTFDVARGGAIVALLLGAVIFGAIAISALFLPEERATRLQFVLGGVLGIGALVALDMYAADYVRNYLSEYPLADMN